jgi:hypothetical protein
MNWFAIYSYESKYVFMENINYNNEQINYYKKLFEKGQPFDVFNPNHWQEEVCLVDFGVKSALDLYVEESELIYQQRMNLRSYKNKNELELLDHYRSNIETIVEDFCYMKKGPMFIIIPNINEINGSRVLYLWQLCGNNWFMEIEEQTNEYHKFKFVGLYRKKVTGLDPVIRISKYINFLTSLIYSGLYKNVETDEKLKEYRRKAQKMKQQVLRQEKNIRNFRGKIL